MLSAPAAFTCSTGRLTTLRTLPAARSRGISWGLRSWTCASSSAAWPSAASSRPLTSVTGLGAGLPKVDNQSVTLTKVDAESCCVRLRVHGQDRTAAEEQAAHRSPCAAACFALPRGLSSVASSILSADVYKIWVIAIGCAA